MKSMSMVSLILFSHLSVCILVFVETRSIMTNVNSDVDKSNIVRCDLEIYQEICGELFDHSHNLLNNCKVTGTHQKYLLHRRQEINHKELHKWRIF